MINHLTRCSLLLGFGLCLSGYAADEFSTSPVEPAELEALYTAAIERRTADILEVLELEDDAQASAVHDVIINQYRALRARDAVVDDYLIAKGSGDGDSSESQRAALTAEFTEPLHRLYVETLSAYLTPEQLETVKDQMTYNKVKVTFDAYCEIIPELKDNDKKMILKWLRAAREEAINGGSADEKHAIFDRYKERINTELNANGYDVDKAFKEWEAKQGLAASADGGAPATSN